MADHDRATKPLCPNCQSCDVIPLLGMLPAPSNYDASNMNRPLAAQCAKDESEAVDHDWRCQGCGHEWDQAGEEPAGE